MSDELLATQPIVKINGVPVNDNQLLETVVDLDSTRPSMFVVRLAQTMFPGDRSGSLAMKPGDAVEISVSDESKTLIKGEITGVEGSFAGGEKSLLIGRGFDKSHRLHRARKYRTFLNVKDSDLVSQLAGEAGLTANATATAQVHKFIAQVNQTDWEFLRWRAEENGFELSASDGKLNFKPVSLDGAPVGELSGDQETLGNVLRKFRPRINAPLVSTVKTAAWDEATKTAFTGQATVSNSKGAAKLSKTPGGYQGPFGAVTHLSARRSAEAAGDLTGLAEAVAGRFADAFVDAEAVARGNPLFLPGALVKIRDTHNDFDGTYRITAARHVFDPKTRYETTMRFTGLEDRSLLALTNGSSAAPTRTPRIEGLVPGVVTNTNDPETRLRVKVKFPWLDDAVESDWMRTIQIGAGPQHGAAFLPEVGDEVIVAFEQGDFRRGYVLGGVYNGTDSPDPKLGDILSGGNPARRGYSSTKNHRLIFDDEVDGKSGVHLITGDDQLEIYMDKQNTTIKIDCKSGKVEIHGAQDVSVKSDANVVIEAKGQLNMKGTGGVTIESSATASFKASASMSIEGATTAVKGTGQLSLEASGPASLKGAIVNIN